MTWKESCCGSSVTCKTLDVEEAVAWCVRGVCWWQPVVQRQSVAVGCAVCLRLFLW